MKRKFFDMFTFVAVFLLCLLVIGCNGEYSDVEDGTGFVCFSEENSAQRDVSGIEQKPSYPTENLYWAYVAVKKSGLHTIGESITESATEGKTVLLDGKNYVLRPVRVDGYGTPLKGLGVCSEAFSFGTWQFRVYGYTGYDTSTGKFSGLVYSGDTVGALQTTPVYTELNYSTTPVSVAFRLKTESGYSAKSTLVFSNVFLSVVDDMFLPKNGVVSVVVSDITGTATVIANGTSEALSQDVTSGMIVPVAFTFVSGKNLFDTDSTTGKTERKLKFEVKYTPAGGSASDITNASKVSVVPVVFSAGSVTVLSGSLSSLNFTDNNLDAAGDLGAAVAKILKTGKTAGSTSHDDYGWFSSLKDATHAIEHEAEKYKNTSGSVNRIILVRDVDRGDIDSITCDVDLNGHYVRNVGMFHVDGGDDVTINFHPGVGSTKTYSVKFPGISIGGNFNGQMLNFMGYSEVGSGTGAYNVVYIDAYDVAVVIDAAGDDVWCTGYSSKTYTVNAVANDKVNGKGCHFDVMGVPNLTFKAGFIDIGENVHIGTLSATAGSDSYVTCLKSTVLRGRPSTSIGNYTSWRNNSTVNTNLSTQTAFSYVKIYGNGGMSTSSYAKDSGTTIYWYGIEGMDLELPAFVFNTAKAGCRSSDFFTTMPDGSGDVYTVGSKIHLGSGGQNLYCVWKQPVGGTIYFIRGKYLPSGTISTSGVYTEDYAGDTITGQSDGSVLICGVRYYFYDSSGNLKSLSGKTHCLTGYAYGDSLGDNTTKNYDTGYKPTSSSNMLAALNGASYYVKLGISKDDYVFVSKTAVTTGTLPKSGYYNFDYKTKYSWTQNKGIGAGKITAYKALKSGATTKKDFIYHDASNTYTVWAVIDYLNGGQDDTGTTAKAYSGLNTAFTKVSGCTDWYLPSLKECDCLRTCGLTTGFNTGKYVMCCSFWGEQCYGWNCTVVGSSSGGQRWTTHPHSGGWQEIILIRSF